MCNRKLFNNRPVDKDTKVLSRRYLTFDGHDVLWEKWLWDGIRGNTLVFVASQFEGVADDELDRIARQIAGLPGEASTTLKRTGDYIFFNFGFRTS